jgi:hypothetical protein
MSNDMTHGMTHGASPILAKLFPAILSFLLGSGATGIAGFFSLSARVSVLEARHEDLGARLTDIGMNIRAVNDKLDRLLLEKRP